VSLHRGARQHIEMLALALEPSTMVNSTGMRWRDVSLPLKSYSVDVGDQVAA
jgi:hypothetical protein